MSVVLATLFLGGHSVLRVVFNLLATSFRIRPCHVHRKIMNIISIICTHGLPVRGDLP